MMDKHTKRWLFEEHDFCGESVCASDVMRFINESDGDSEDLAYIRSAWKTLPDSIHKDAAYLKLLHKIGGIK
ncbi:MAG: hypothetical protein ACO1OT_05600 [Heyndrickxia sp.]